MNAGAWIATIAGGSVGVGVTLAAAIGALRYSRRPAPKPWCAQVPLPSEIPSLPAPSTAAARRGQELHRAFAGAAADGLWNRPPARPDSPLVLASGTPGAARDLLAGIADVLIDEAASAAVRGDEHNARTLLWVEDFVRDARDSIVDD